VAGLRVGSSPKGGNWFLRGDSKCVVGGLICGFLVRGFVEAILGDERGDNI